MVKAIDFMNYLVTPEATANFNKAMEGELVCKMQASIEGGWPAIETDQLIKNMDEANVDKVFISDCKMFSSWSKKMLMDNGAATVAAEVQKYPDRLVGLAGYNPFRIMESLYEIETAVKEYNFKGVYVHIYGFEMPLTDARMYPLYAKCSELGIPVSMQVGHVLEAMPSKYSYPMFLDEIALHFPKLKIIGAHTGYPWTEDLIAVSWKWDNIYFGVDAHMPKYLDKKIVDFINSRGQDKVIWGTNGLPFKPVLDQLEALGLRETAKNKLLRENAIRIYNLE